MKKIINCPSSFVSRGSRLFMVKDENNYFQPIEEIKITSTFFNHIKDDSAFLEKVRVTNPCSTNQCLKWQEGKCHAMDGYSQSAKKLDVASSEMRFRNCSINNTCRWYIQDGLNSCAVCADLRNDDYYVKS